MAAAENVNAPDVEERDQEVYPPRGEEDLESVIDEMEEVENEDVEEAVREISSVADDTLRSEGVGDHFQAPIRSMNNPAQNEVELENGEEAQVVGEEYFVGQNLPGFQDVGNIKWWTVMDENSYREETRSGGLEHLQMNNEGDIHSYRVELDGEPLDNEGVQRLARNLRIRRDKDTPVERNQIPENIMEYSSREELLENEDLTEDEYAEQVQSAQEYGLITEDGEITLKGFIASQDMEARDLRSLDNAANGAETIDTATRGVLDKFAEGDFDESIELRSTGMLTPLGNISAEVDTSGEGIEVPDSSPASYLDITETDDGYNVQTGQVPVDTILNSYFSDEVVEDGEVNISELEERHPELASRIIEYKERRTDDLEYTDVKGTASLELDVFEGGDEEAHREVLESEFGLSIEEMSEELENNSTIEVNDEEKISINYKGDEIPERIVRDLKKDRRGSWNEGEINLGSGALMPRSTAQIVLHQFTDELSEKHDYNTKSRAAFDRIEDYQDISTEIDETLERMEEKGVIDTEIVEEEPAKVSLNPEEKEDYRLIDRLHSETDIDLPSEIKEIKTETLETQTVWNVRRDYDDVEDLDEELEDYKEEITSLIAENTSRQVWKSFGREDELDYTAEGIRRKIHEFVDSRDSEILRRTRYDLLGKPEKETVREEIGPAYSNLEFTVADDAELADYMEDSMDAASEDLYETLEELEEEGLLELTYQDQNETRYGDAETEVLDYEGEFEVENYHELDEEDRERLKELDEEGVLELDESRRDLKIEEDGLRYIANVETESTTVDTTEREDRVRGEYQESTTYEVNDQIREIGETLDPLNFDSEPYEEVTFDTDFEYGEELAA